MADLNRPAETNSFLEEPRKIPEMLNVLTILTFVGSGIGIVSSVWGFTRAKASYDQMVELQGKMDQMPDTIKKMMGADPVEMARKAYESRIPILLLALIGCALCIYGAMEMRKLKKTGFTIYVIGELLPIVSTLIFLGSAAAGGFAIIGYLIYIVFIVLYATQLKYLR
jgi:hypothetical protein